MIEIVESGVEAALWWNKHTHTEAGDDDDDDIIVDLTPSSPSK
jgi:hypothetical protein